MMEDPERLLDCPASALERALLQEGRAYRGPERLRAQTLAALGVAGSAGLVSGVFAWLLARSWSAKLLFALSTVTVLVAVPVGYYLVAKDARSPQAAAQVMVAATQPSPAVPATPTQSVPVREPAQELAVPVPVSVPAAPTRTGAATNSSLRAELAALDRVRVTLANGDPTGASAFLASYFRAFPRGRLHLEAEVLRIDALAKAGQSDVAKRNAQDFIRRHPNSVLTARVRPFAEP
jgi:hypothetical protein